MRAEVNEEKLRSFMREIGRLASGPGRIYLTGGATALLYGFRKRTIDIDIKLDPEPPGVFEAIATLKDSLQVNVELASPDDFIPAIPGWRERSPFIARYGQVDFFHYDLYGQALAKIERGHAQDMSDVANMIEHGLIAPDALRAYFHQIVPGLVRYPAVDPNELQIRLNAFLNPERSRDANQ